MSADIETCDGHYYHMEHYWDSNKKYCPGIYRELSDAIRAWNKLHQDVKKVNSE